MLHFVPEVCVDYRSTFLACRSVRGDAVRFVSLAPCSSSAWQRPLPGYLSHPAQSFRQRDKRLSEDGARTAETISRPRRPSSSERSRSVPTTLVRSPAPATPPCAKVACQRRGLFSPARSPLTRPPTMQSRAPVWRRTEREIQWRHGAALSGRCESYRVIRRHWHTWPDFRPRSRKMCSLLGCGRG